MENGILIPILTDADINSIQTATGRLLVGDEQLYLGKPLNFIHRAAWIAIFADIYYLSPQMGAGATPTSVRVTADYGVDGVNWTGFSGNLLAPTTATGLQSSRYTTLNDFGPLVRINVGLTGDTVNQVAGAGRLTVVANIRFF